ncbi:MAG TPA: hypothetical protein RMH99_11670 [Sandaracinaceae bacterium LLY-WYZ-13_1]|nr:hypothetical protein [Sandaracinaceae bacterium LLY-WYZ-13_1]
MFDGGAWIADDLGLWRWGGGRWARVAPPLPDGRALASRATGRHLELVFADGRSVRTEASGARTVARAFPRPPDGCVARAAAWHRDGVLHVGLSCRDGRVGRVARVEGGSLRRLSFAGEPVVSLAPSGGTMLARTSRGRVARCDARRCRRVVAGSVVAVVGLENGGGWIVDERGRARPLHPDDTLGSPIRLPGLTGAPYDVAAAGDDLWVNGHVPRGPDGPTARFVIRGGAVERRGRPGYAEHLGVVGDQVWGLSRTGIERLDAEGSLPLRRPGVPRLVGVDPTGAVYARRGAHVVRVFEDGHRVRVPVPASAEVLAVPDGRPLIEGDPPRIFVPSRGFEPARPDVPRLGPEDVRRPRPGVSIFARSGELACHHDGTPPNAWGAFDLTGEPLPRMASVISDADGSVLWAADEAGRLWVLHRVR